MRNLTLVGLSEDGHRIVFVDDAGSEFAAPVDDRLKAVLTDKPRPTFSQLEIHMDSALRPRDIQARIRSGDSPETVAALAQVPVEKIMAYCVPVLAERQHVADVAQRSHVRRKNVDGPAQRLSQVVAQRLRGRGIDPDSSTWDAWRRDDGRWTVSTSYHSGESERSARFVFDNAGRYSVAEDDEAKWLTGERQSSSKGPQPRESGKGGRRLSAVPTGDDLLSVPDDEPTDDLTAVARAVGEEQDEEVTPQAPPAPDEVDTESTAGAQESEDSSDRQGLGEPETSPTGETAAEAPADAASSGSTKRRSKKETERSKKEADKESTSKRKRRTKHASVPSWDEIMFGKPTDTETEADTEAEAKDDS